MTDYRDLSRLPDDEAYWTQLEARVLAGLATPVPASSGKKTEWWAPLAARAYVLGGAALAAGVAALLLVPGRAAPDATGAGLVRVPDDDRAFVAMLSAPTPPSIATLMLPRAGRDQDD